MSDTGISRRDLVRRGGLAAAGGAALFGLAGCARREEFAQGGADVNPSSSGGVAKTGLLTRGQIRIEMPTHMEPQDPNTAIMQNGAEQAAKDFGVKVNFRGPDKFSIPAIQKIFDASIASRPTAIAATLPDPAALGPKIEEAVAKGIPVVLFNAGLDDFERLGALTYVGQTELEAGKQAGERLAKAGLRNVVVINHQQGQLTLETRAKGVQQGVGGGSVKSFAVDGTSPTQIKNGVASALRQNPDAQALITLGPGAAEQALAAIKASGKEGKVKLATFDISPAVLNAVKAKQMLFAIDQQMFFQTYMSVMSLVTYSEWRLRPVTAVPSGPLFVDAGNAAEIITLSSKGIH
jgi:simple sugar transport system substrate-binding protein